MQHPLIRLAIYVMLVSSIVGCSAGQTTHDNAPDTSTIQATPKVLLIGDSISQGYRATVVKELEGEADVQRIQGNGQWAGHGVLMIDEWLGDTEWDVIHFNFGLWDMYGWKYYDEDRSPESYAQRLEKIVARLKQTDATLIWATTTPPCPENEVSMRDRFKKPGVVTAEVEKQYLDAADRVMRRHRIRINDLNALVRDDLATWQTGPDNVHFTAEGRERLGKQVAKSIRDAIETR